MRAASFPCCVAPVADVRPRFCVLHNHRSNMLSRNRGHEASDAGFNIQAVRENGIKLQASATAVCGCGLRADLSKPGVAEAIRFVRISSCWLQVWLAIGVFSFVAKHSVLLSAGSVDGCLGLQKSMNCLACLCVRVCHPRHMRWPVSQFAFRGCMHICLELWSAH